MNTYPRVDLTYHADGNVGIGTPPDASAPLVMGEPVERIRFMMSNQEPEAHVFAHPTTEWARVDKDLNVTHLDMELCAKGPQNVYTALALAIWNKAIAHERRRFGHRRLHVLLQREGHPELRGPAAARLALHRSG